MLLFGGETKEIISSCCCYSASESDDSIVRIFLLFGSEEGGPLYMLNVQLLYTTGGSADGWCGRDYQCYYKERKWSRNCVD